MSFAPFRLLIGLLIVWLVVATVSVLPGALRLNGHPVDFIHMLDIGYRMVAGDQIHRDFVTPLGALAFLPLTLFLEQGFGPARAYLLAQASVALVLIPGVWWVAMSRLEGWVRWVFGIGMVILPMALSFGGENPAVVASMYYNRWAWVLAGLVILILMLEPRPGWRAGWVDGVILGLSGVALLTLKATFVVGLLPFALVAILSGRLWGTFVVALLVAAAAAAGLTLEFGTDLWLAYLGNLLAVSSTELRSYPGEDLSGLVSAPAHLAGTLLILATVIYLRRVGQNRAGLLLLLLAPGVVYITYQNWGNDPKWLFLLAVMLPMLPPKKEGRVVFGQPASAIAPVFSLVALVLYAPSLLNIATSPLRHMVQQANDYVPIFSDISKQDVQVIKSVAYEPKAEIRLAGFEPPEPAEGEEAPREPLVFLGEELESCNLRFGVLGWTQKAVEQLGAVEEAVGKRVLVADVYDYLWLFGPFERLNGMAPWYYGGDGGFDDAEYVLVPFCPLVNNMRRAKLEVIEDQGWVLEEVIRSDLFILARRAG